MWSRSSFTRANDRGRRRATSRGCSRRPTSPRSPRCVRYLLTVSSSDERPLVHDVVAALPDPEKEEAVKKVKTIADALREEGRAAVLAEVEARIHAEVETRIRAERADALERMRASVEKHLRLKFGALPEHVSARLAKASLDELDGIAERLLFAPSLDAALDAR
jgi:hypothetical protein